MSEWHAVEAVSESIERTTNLLFKPFSLDVWLRIALVVFLLGMSGASLNFTLRGGDLSSLKDLGIEFTREVVMVIIAAIAILLFLSLVFQFISAVFSFVFIEALFENRIEFVDGFKRNTSKGLHLFLFNLGIGIVSLIIIAASLLAGVFIGVTMRSEIAVIVVMVLWLLFVIAYMVVLSIFLSLTSDFVVPLMHFGCYGVIKGWKRVWEILTKSLSQFLMYIIIKIAFGMMTGIIEFLIGLGVLLVAIAGILILGGGSALAWIGLTMLAPSLSKLTIVVITAAILLLGIIIFVTSYVMVILTLPIPVFFRFYGILFLQRIYPELNPPPKALEQPAEKPRLPEEKKIAVRGSTKKKDKKTSNSNDKIKAY